MATLFYCVFDVAGATALGEPLQVGTTAIGASSAQSDAITGDGRKRRVVRCHSDADCFVTWGVNPTATIDGTSGIPLGAENPEYFNIEAGHKLAVIQRV